jgi:predicted DNA-binding transcriptional regulator AlpA
VAPGKMVRLVEIAQILGVSKQRADQLRRRPDFPAPVDRYSRGDLWAASDVERWAQTWAGGAVGDSGLTARPTNPPQRCEMRAHGMERRTSGAARNGPR